MCWHYMFGQFAGAVLEDPLDDDPGDVDPEEPEELEEPEDGVVVELVAAWAAAAPPTTRAPDTASTAVALRIACILLTSSLHRVCLRPVGHRELRAL
ncbi:MAG TPA: hypothetical protein VL119_07435 [Acidimicrobiia bacterium]|nr:hypothetical protein [Acidimicrobiia bacterium]